MWYWLALWACNAPLKTLDPPADHRPSRGVPNHAAGEALDASASEVRLNLPPSSHAEGQSTPDVIALAHPFSWHKKKGDTDIYRTPLPVALHLMPSPERGTHHIGSQAPIGFELHGVESQVPFHRNASQAGTWGFDRDYLYVGVSRGAQAPEPVDFFVRYPRATAEDASMNYVSADLPPRSFAQRTVTIGTSSHRGLLLPAPSRASWVLDVPAQGRLGFRARVLPAPIVSLDVTDGAEVKVTVTAEGVEEYSGTWAVDQDGWVSVSVDLDRYSGQQVSLTVDSDPAGSSVHDYVFLEDPVVFASSETPRRVALIFVDTLRPDHLGMYGYAERPTSPALDRWSEHAVVFEEARSVAPWTLPSARAALSGAQPEWWFEERTLAERLGESGWRTEAFVTNAFLSQPFDMHRGWDRYRYTHLASTREVVDAAMEALEDQQDRDLLLMLHLMEPHLPYEEPWSYRWRFAGRRPASLRSLTRHWLLEMSPDHEDRQAIEDYVRARYDANIRAMDDQIFRLLNAMGPDATVVLFSDHGEEFWEHDSFEHGHSFYDELLRVPLVIRSPHLPAGRVHTPVSLLDLTPTVLDLAGLPSGVRQGRSLVPLAWGDSSDEMEGRPHGFGRPLYGPDGWGVVDEGRKWYRRGRTESWFDLALDPEELKELADPDQGAQYASRMAEALDRPVVQAWRIKLYAKGDQKAVSWHVSHPSGLERVWPSYDPRGRASGTAPQRFEGEWRVEKGPGEQPPAAIYVLPPVDDPTECAGLKIELKGVDVGPHTTCSEMRGRHVEPMFMVGDSRWGASVDLVWTPLPEGVAVEGYAEELKSQLQELGYMD